MNRLTYILIIVTFVTQLCLGQSNVIDSITKGLQQNDITELIEWLNDDLQITLLEEEDSYEKEKGVEVLKEFFDKLNTEGYELKHNGESADGSKFVIGELHSKEDTYRIYYVLNDQKVTEFCIELD